MPKYGLEGRGAQVWHCVRHIPPSLKTVYHKVKIKKSKDSSKHMSQRNIKPEATHPSDAGKSQEDHSNQTAWFGIDRGHRDVDGFPHNSVLSFYVGPQFFAKGGKVFLAHPKIFFILFARNTVTNVVPPK